MENYTVRVVVPVYNAEKTVARCLDSLLAQTFTDWKAVLVDDCSTDNSADIIQKYAERDSRFVYIKQSANGGASKARNTALEYEGSEYTAFLDSDDYWEAQMLEKMMAKAKEYNADVVQCRFIYDFPGGAMLAPAGAFGKETVLEGKEMRKVYIRMMTGINMNHVCMKLIRTDMMSGIHFDTELKTAEDLELNVQLFKKVKKYCFIPDVMYHYVRGETSLTGSGLSGKEKLRANKYVSRVMCDALPAWKINTPFYKLLCLMRPYIIIVSKIFRTIREKIFK